MRKTNRKKQRKAAFACELIGGILLVAVILCCVPLTLPRLAGLQIFEVVSGSMEPAIPTGSLVYVQETAPEEPETGDIIAFYSSSGSGAVITHRVVQNQTVSGQFITKGDANSQEDMTPVSYDYYLGKVVFTLPRMGALLSEVATAPGRITAVCAVAAAVLFHMTGVRLRKRETAEVECRSD